CNAASVPPAWFSRCTTCSRAIQRPTKRRSATRSPAISAAAQVIDRSSQRPWITRDPTETKFNDPTLDQREQSMPLMARGKDVAEGKNVLQVRGGAMSTKMVYGNDCNLMVAVRAPGYHSNPHKHDCEQLNYVLDGEVWVFVDNDAFLMKAGDFSRIP